MSLLTKTLPLVLLTAFAFAQSPSSGKKPVLIRVDKDEDKKLEPEVITPNPAQSEEHVSVGDFYFKRDNYEAARERYRDAVLYNPKSVKAYEKLIETLERLGQFQEALLVCREFIDKNPESKKIQDFQKKIGQLERKNLDNQP